MQIQYHSPMRRWLSQKEDIKEKFCVQCQCDWGKRTARCPEKGIGPPLNLHCPCRLSSANDNEAWLVTVYHWNPWDFIHLIFQDYDECWRYNSFTRKSRKMGTGCIRPKAHMASLLSVNWPESGCVGKTVRTWCVPWYFSPRLQLFAVQGLPETEMVSLNKVGFHQLSTLPLNLDKFFRPYEIFCKRVLQLNYTLCQEPPPRVLNLLPFTSRF